MRSTAYPIRRQGDCTGSLTGILAVVPLSWVQPGGFARGACAQDGGEISVRYLDVIGIARRLASMLGRCNNDDRKLGVSMLDRLPHAAHLAVCEDQRCPHSHLPL